MDESLLTFNGIDAETGSYLMPPSAADRIAAVAASQSQDRAFLAEQSRRRLRATDPTLAPREGVDPKDLRQSGWAVVFGANEDPDVIAALGPLIEHRRATVQDERRLRVLTGDLGYAGESKLAYLQKVGASPTGAADPDLLPYYVLLVGGPKAIPFSLQYHLDVQYAVGRIDLDAVDGYAAYARSVVAAESRSSTGPPRAAFFGTQHDPATELSATKLVGPVADALLTSHPGVRADRWIGAEATKERIKGLIGGPDTPDLLFAAAHGLACRSGAPDQRARQGAVVCQEWPGPGNPVTEAASFGASDVPDKASLLGLVAFLFACFGAGTPRHDDFLPTSEGQQVELAPEPFVSALAKRLLGHPAGGALALVGHVERAWGYSFVWKGQTAFTAVFEDAFRRLLDGHPVGSALEGFSVRHAELAVDLEALLSEVGDRRVDRSELAGLWTAKNDARNFVLLGDPAVRLTAGRSAGR
jgi:Peptidase family C25